MGAGGGGGGGGGEREEKRGTEGGSSSNFMAHYCDPSSSISSNPRRITEDRFSAAERSSLQRAK